MLHSKEAANLASQNVHTDLAVWWPLAVCSPLEGSCFEHSFPHQILHIPSFILEHREHRSEVGCKIFPRRDFNIPCSRKASIYL